LTSLISRADIYDPKTLAVMDQAFTAIWNVFRADDPFRDYATDRPALFGCEISPWRACLSHVIEERCPQ
jgi:hypothetical protein